MVFKQVVMAQWFQATARTRTQEQGLMREGVCSILATPLRIFSTPSSRRQAGRKTEPFTGMAQRERAGLITPRSQDQNLLPVFITHRIGASRHWSTLSPL